jgi:hypothetical protein
MKKMSTMSQRGLEQFEAYEKARILFDLVVTDMQNLKADNRCSPRYSNPDALFSPRHPTLHSTSPDTFLSLRNKNRSAPES